MHDAESDARKLEELLERFSDETVRYVLTQRLAQSSEKADSMDRVGKWALENIGVTRFHPGVGFEGTPVQIQFDHRLSASLIAPSVLTPSIYERGAPLIFAQQQDIQQQIQVLRAQAEQARQWSTIEVACGGEVPLHVEATGTNLEMDGPLGESQGAVAIQLAEEEARANARSKMEHMIGLIRCQKGCSKQVSKISVSVSKSWAVSKVDLWLVSWERGHAIAEATATVSCKQ